MKKIMMIAAMMVMTIAAKAQNEVGQLTLKPMVGMTIANITNADGDAKIGLAAGAEFEYGVAEKFSITAGAVYSMQGSKASMNYSESGVTIGGDVSVNFGYINIPILAQYYIAPGLAIKAGIQPGFNVSHDSDIDLNVSIGGTKIDLEDLEDYMEGWDYSDNIKPKTFDFSIPVGISYEISDFVIDARYQWGLTKMFDDGSDTKNSVFMISLGYKFGL